MTNKEEPFTAFELIKELKRLQLQNCRYLLHNAFIYRWDWESDLFVLKDSGFSWEFEIKISRNDYKKDFTKFKKHKLLEETRKNKTSKHIIPNKFWYVVPKDLIKKEEIPEYAGLMYFSRGFGFEVIKEAPTIHKDVHEFDKLMVKKFFHRLINLEGRFRDKELMNILMGESKKNQDIGLKENNEFSSENTEKDESTD